MNNEKAYWWAMIVDHVRRNFHWSVDGQHYIWLCGLFYEWNQDGWELSYYTNPGARRSWHLTCTRSGNHIQPGREI
jgi:hypothetical protein